LLEGARFARGRRESKRGSSKIRGGTESLCNEKKRGLVTWEEMVLLLIFEGSLLGEKRILLGKIL